MTQGTIVRYAKPEPREETLTFVVREHNGDRVMIESLDFPDWRIKPTENVLVTDVVEVAR